MGAGIAVLGEACRALIAARQCLLAARLDGVGVGRHVVRIVRVVARCVLHVLGQRHSLVVGGGVVGLILGDERLDLGHRVHVRGPDFGGVVAALAVVGVLDFLELGLGVGLGALGGCHVLDLQVIEDEVLVATEGGGGIGRVLQVGSGGGRVDAEPAVAGDGTGDLELGRAVLAQGLLQVGELDGAGVVLAVTGGDGVDVVGAGLVLERHLVGLARFQLDVLRDRLVDQRALLDQAVGLDGPLAVEHVVHLLDIPAGLRERGMQLGQVDTVVLDAFGAGDHERPDALGIVLEVVGERLQGAVSVERQALVTVLKHAHVIEVHMVGVVACAGVRERHLDVAAFRSHEPHVHVLEVAAAAFSVRVRVVAVRLDVVLGDRLAGLVGGEDLGAVGHGDLGRGVGAVVHAHVDRVTLARGQVGELLGDLHVTGQAQHGVVGAFDFGLAGAGDGPVVLEGVLAAVEAGVHDVHAFAPLDGDLLLGALGHDVRGLGLGGQRDLAAGDGDGLLVGLALVGELVHLDGGEVLPILRQGPLGGAALGIPVVQLLIGGLDELAGVHVPQPRQQVGLSALDGVAVARGDRAGRHGDAVERDGAVAVRAVVGVVGATGQDDDVAVVVLQRDLLVAVVDGGILHGGGVERAVDPADDLEVLDELGGHIVRVQVPDVRGVVVASLPAFEVLHTVAAEQRGVRGLAVRRVVADPAVLLVVAQEAHDLRILALHAGTTVGKVGGPVLEGCVILVAGTPFGGHTPAVLIDHLAHLAGFPRVLGAGGVVAPHVEVDEVHVVADLALEVSEAGLAHAGGEIVDAVDADALIQPVPAVAQAATGVATHHVLAEGPGFRVHFGRVDVHAEAGAVLGALLHQGVHVRGAAGAGVDVAVVRMAGVVAFVAVALEQHGLAEAVGVEGDLLDVVKRGQERVLRLGAEVHGDAPCDQLGHFL